MLEDLKKKKIRISEFISAAVCSKDTLKQFADLLPE